MFIEINIRVRLWCCLCHRCKLGKKENNLVACVASEFYPSRERAASGCSLCSWVLFRIALLILGPCCHWWSSVLEHSEARRLATWKPRDQKKGSPESALDFTALYPMVWSGINRAPDLRAGKAQAGHPDNFPTLKRMILVAEYLLGLYHSCF